MIGRFCIWSAVAWGLVAGAPVVLARPAVMTQADDPILPIQGMFEHLGRVIPPPPGAHAFATGTAFFIPPFAQQLRLLTAAHVVDSCLRIDILSDSLPPMHAELMTADTKADLAIVRLPALAPSQRAQPVTTLFFPPLSVLPPGAGATLTLIGYPEGGMLLRATLSKVTNVTTTVPRPADPTAVLLIQGAGAHGDSGAPILNDRGQVVGIVRGVVTDMAKATHLMGAPIEHVAVASAPLAISYLFLMHPIGAMPISAGAPDATPEHLRLAVVRVICWRDRLVVR